MSFRPNVYGYNQGPPLLSQSISNLSLNNNDGGASSSTRQKRRLPFAGGNSVVANNVASNSSGLAVLAASQPQQWQPLPSVAVQQQQLVVPVKGVGNQMIMMEDLLTLLQQQGLTNNNTFMASLYANSQEYDHKKSLSGVWILLHKKAEWHDSNGDVDGFASFLAWLASVFWCDECAVHFRKYLQDNPPKDADHMTVYMFNFHNAVNRRLNKPEMDWKTYVEVYRTHPEKICSSCSAGKPPLSKGGNNMAARQWSMSDYDSLFL